MKRLLTLFFVPVILITGCGKNSDESSENILESEVVTYSEKEMQLIEAGYLDVEAEIPELRVDLRYSTSNNFVTNDVYGDVNHVFLHPVAVEKLKTALKVLQSEKPGYTFLVFDGARPQSVQQKFWDFVAGTSMQGYVANPSKGSIHSYGLAVDLTLIDENGKEVDMGTPFDSFEDIAQPRYEADFLELGILTSEQVENRELLRYVMTNAGYSFIRNEWWHFNAEPRSVVTNQYPLIN